MYYSVSLILETIKRHHSNISLPEEEEEEEEEKEEKEKEEEEVNKVKEEEHFEVI